MNIILKFFLVFLFFNSWQTMSQVKVEDEIILKDGRSFVGIVIEQRPGKHIKLLELPSKDTLTLAVGDIQVMRKIVDLSGTLKTDSLIDQTSEIATDSIILDIDSTIYNVRPFYLSLGASAGGGDWSSIGMGIKLFRTINPKLQLGLGITFLGENVESANPINTIFPLTAEIRYGFQSFMGGRSSFLANLSTGIHFMDGQYPLGNNNFANLQNGFYFQPGLAYRLNFTKNTGLVFEVSYQMIQTSARQVSTDELIKRHTYSGVQGSLSLFF